MADELATEYAPMRFQAVLLAAFSSSALGLTAIGPFAVLSHAVSRRTGEIGLRMALGATPRRIAYLVLGSGLRPLAVGIALGLAGAALVARLMSGLLYEVPPFDSASFLGAASALLGVSVAAGLLPARRAAGLDPMQALREE